MIEKTKKIIINFFLIFVKITFLIPYVIHHILFIQKKKRKPFSQSFVVKLLDNYPFIYECSILIWNFPIWQKIYKKIELEENEYILQIGCGTGLFNKGVTSDVQIDNLDINEKYLKYGKKKGRFENYIVGSVYDIESKDEKYDTVLLARCFHHLKKPKKALIECARVIKRNGRIIIYDPVSDQKNVFQTRYINTEYDGMIYDYHYKTFTNYVMNIIPQNIEIEKIEYDKNFTVTNYNYKYPHVDAYIVLRKQN